ncbi:MAG: YecA family protein [Pirellulales bacterium]
MPKISRNDPCPCGSGNKYKRCCYGKDFEWHESDDGEISRQMPLSPEMAKVVEELRTSFVERHGREPAGDDLLFEQAPPPEVVLKMTLTAMRQVEIDPALIYAFKKTRGILLSEANEPKVPVSDVQEFEDALDEYARQTGEMVKQRRFSEDDLDAIMQVDPDKLIVDDGFVKSLPFPPPFTKEHWSRQRLTDIIDDKQIWGYFQTCQKEVVASGRASRYLNMFMLLAETGGVPDDSEERDYAAALRQAKDRHFSVDELRDTLETVQASCAPGGAIPNAAAAFEFLSFVCNFMDYYAEHLGQIDQLKEAIQGVSNLGVIAFVAAVNIEFGQNLDAWD